MRMDRQQPLSAVEVVNQYDEQALQRMFSRYGEVRNARRLARRIADARTGEAIVSTGQLRNIAASVAYGRESQYLARVFQAIRIEVNQELEALQDFLSQAADLLVKGGRLVVISYHSLEDRIVKNFMRYGVFEGEPVRDLYGRFEHVLKVVTRKPVEAGQEEINTNPRARSARLRIAEKL